MSEIIDELEAETDYDDTGEVDIFISPPENATGVITDEDSGEEDDMNANNLPGTVLRAEAQIKGKYTESTSVAEFSMPSKSDNLLSTSNKRQKKNVYIWSKEDGAQQVNENFPLISTNATELSPLEWFSCFIDEDVVDLLVTETNKYIARRNGLGDVTNDEMKCVIGILLLSGYLCPARRRMYWENASDTHNELVVQAISRDRFDFVFRHLHLNDLENYDAKDKFTKIRPLLNSLNAKFLHFGPISEHHSVDESMVPYFGRHGCKQFIRNKPIRYGYKQWMGTCTFGYIFWFEPYQGASTPVKEEYKSFGLGGSVVLQYCDVLQEKTKQASFPNYHLCFDNFFTSIPLLMELKIRGIRGTGTIRDNRLLNCPITDVKTMEKGQRGSFEFAVAEKTVLVCRWRDNKVVTFATNSESVNPIGSVSRYSQKEKKRIQVTQPNVIAKYNKFMGGVDRADQNISVYRVSIRGKKWYYPRIMHCFDMCEQNAWLLHRKNGGKLDHLSFRRRVATALLETYRRTAKRGPSKPSQRENQDSRYDRQDHLVICQEKQTRCQHCHQKCTTRCQKCDVGLHTKCFILYHTK